MQFLVLRIKRTINFIHLYMHITENMLPFYALILCCIYQLSQDTLKKRKSLLRCITEVNRAKRLSVGICETRHGNRVKINPIAKVFQERTTPSQQQFPTFLSLLFLSFLSFFPFFLFLLYSFSSIFFSL